MKRKMSKKQAFKERRDMIIDKILKANEKYIKYNENPELQTINNYKEIISLVNEFYLDGTRYVQVNKTIIDPFPVKMLKSLETDYPKEYKKILKVIKKENINIKDLVSFGNFYFENAMLKQEKQIINARNSMKEIVVAKELNKAVMSEATHISLEELKEIVDKKNITSKAELKEEKINIYSAESFAKLMDEENSKNLEKEKNKQSEKNKGFSL